MGAAAIWVIGPHRQGVLGRQHPALTLGGDQLADDAFALPARVGVGGIDKVATRLAEPLDDADSLIPGRTPTAPGVTEDHRPRHSSDTRRPVLPSSL